jgi:outer membrane protein OmpA-like peptidoglycan-associated protein
MQRPATTTPSGYGLWHIETRVREAQNFVVTKPGHRTAKAAADMNLSARLAMNITLTSSTGAALLLIAASVAPMYAAHAADPASAPAAPSVQDIVNGLKSDDGDVSTVRTRSLRPGAAAAATAAAAPAAAPSISMQIQFDYASDRISGASRTMVDNLAAALASPDLRDQSFTIVGHTDGRGAADYNMKLSERRAAAVKAYLIKHGVEASRLKALGKGMTQLVNTADPAAAENRRVEIIAGA